MPTSRIQPDAGKQEEATSQPESQYYLRFSLPQRYLHGVLAATFLGLAFTGLPLRFSNAPWALALSNAVGGFGAIIFFHKFCAAALTLAFGIHVANLVYRLVSQARIRSGMGPQFHGAESQRYSGLLRKPEMVFRPRAQTEIRPLRVLGQGRLLGRLLGHGDHRLLRLCHVVRALLREVHPRLLAQHRFADSW